MPSRKETVRQAVKIFKEAAKSYGRSPQTAWLGIYEALLWYEPTFVAGHAALPHIIDADQLRSPARRPRISASAHKTIWQRRAAAVEQYLAQRMSCRPSEVQNRVDRLMRGRQYKGVQRQNPLGIAFIGLVHHALVTYGHPDLRYQTEQMAQEVFPGITFPGRSKAPSIDILVRKGPVPRAIVSVKWSLRHDRINDLTNECPAYKQAASWGRRPLDYVVVTNEYGPARLEKLLGDTCIDAVVHIHKSAVVQVSELDGRLASLLDLTELFDLTRQW